MGIALKAAQRDHDIPAHSIDKTTIISHFPMQKVANRIFPFVYGDIRVSYPPRVPLESQLPFAPLSDMSGAVGPGATQFMLPLHCLDR